MKIEKNAPALPCMPMQDSLGRFFSPISGFTKYEFVVLEIYKSLIIQNKDIIPTDENKKVSYIIRAEIYADAYFEFLNKHEDEKNNISTIIQ